MLSVQYCVLIETLWNVKVEAGCFAYCSDNVLIETLWNVKDVEISHYLNGLLRINRNIVECKVCKIKNYIWIEYVLIETLWNVKKLEQLDFEVISVVLIETLWNVKIYSYNIDIILFTVLIETLWNVKTLIYNTQ